MSIVQPARSFGGGIGTDLPQRLRWPYFLPVLVLISLYLASVGYDIEFYFFLSVLSLGVLAVALVNFEASLLFIPLTLTNPYTLSETGTNLHISELVLLIIFAVWFLRLLPVSETKYILPKKFLWLSGLMILAALASLSVARYFVAGVQQIIRYVEVLVILFLVIVNSCRGERIIRRMFLYLIIGGLFASLVGLVQFSTGELTKGETRRIFGWHGGGYGGLLGSTLLLCLSVLLHERERRFRFWAYATIPFAGVALLLSQTRTWIGAFAAVLGFMILWKKRRLLGKVILVLALIVIALMIIIQTNAFGLVEGNLLRAAIENAFRFGIEPGKRTAEDLSLLLRLHTWQHAISHFLASPFLGIGVGNLRYSDYYSLRLGNPAERTGYVDNQYIQFFTEAGIVAGVSWLLFIFFAFRSGIHAVKCSEGSSLHAPALGSLASLLVFVVGSFFWVVTPHHELFAIMVLNIALLLSITRLRSEEIADKKT